MAWEILFVNHVLSFLKVSLSDNGTNRRDKSAEALLSPATSISRGLAGAEAFHHQSHRFRSRSDRVMCQGIV